jgi:hypothetical protein
MATANPEIISNFALPFTATGGQTGTVLEPSVANNDAQILATGNWYGAVSPDGGATWLPQSPFTFFPFVAGGFCCDQTLIYDQSRNISIWLLQYVVQGGGNVLRVAAQRGAGTPWIWWDLTPTMLNSAWQNEWFDFNHAALSGSSLYVGTNMFSVFGNPQPWTRSVVIRITLDSLNAVPPGPLNMTFFPSTDISMFCTQGATDTMFMAGHRSSTSIRIYSWSEVTNQITQADVNVSATATSLTGYAGTGPDGTNWLARCDDRLLGAWVAQGIIGLMWSSDRAPAAGRPFPYVRVARINAVSKALIDEPDIWNPTFAYAYPAAAPNDSGGVAITLFRGGGVVHPGHVIGVWDDASHTWKLMSTRDGTNGPSDNKWGDYLAIRRHSPDGQMWYASGYTLQGGSTFNFIEPRLVHFRMSVI